MYSSINTNSDKLIINIINNLRLDSSKNNKINILKSIDPLYLDDIKLVFKSTYDPIYNYWIKKIDISNINFKSNTISIIESINLIIDNLHGRKVTGNSALEWLYELLSNMNIDSAKILLNIIDRDLQCGVSHNTIDKVWPKLINKNPYMGCMPFSKETLNNINLPCISQVKEDGLYVDIILNKDTNTIRFFTREGASELLLSNSTLNDKIDKFFTKYPNSTSLVINGECLVLDDAGGYLPRTTGNGLINSDNPPLEKIVFVCWDIIPYAKWINKEKVSINYASRFNMLSKIINIELSDVGFRLIDSKECNTVDDIINHFKECLSKGFEGTVVKNMSSHWANGKSNNQVKIKFTIDTELECIGFKEGTKSNKGKIGSLLCTTSDGLVEVYASGLTKEDRARDVDYFVGSILTVRSCGLVKGKGSDKYSLFLPRVVEKRCDKSVADSYTDILSQGKAFEDILLCIGMSNEKEKIKTKES